MDNYDYSLPRECKCDLFCHCKVEYDRLKSIIEDLEKELLDAKNELKKLKQSNNVIINNHDHESASSSFDNDNNSVIEIDDDVMSTSNNDGKNIETINNNVSLSSSMIFLNNNNGTPNVMPFLLLYPPLTQYSDNSNAVKFVGFEKNIIQNQMIRDEKKYFCLHPGCEKFFKYPSLLRQHLKTHTGEKPHKCQWPNCDSRFADKSNLRHHMRIHSGQKPYQCNVCKQTYSRLDNLSKHCRSKHVDIFNPLSWLNQSQRRQSNVNDQQHQQLDENENSLSTNTTSTTLDESM